ncbi:hypothetical protein [Flavobacterium algicola]|uniref:hypothetical protein n=1 Tax=Flavobacterium algicola TaxID=556529 RepID=UPI001EFD8F7A|nr:hypothetical protein [Flavobacterium algicola]MCG9793563.1 hypothetical protein [Flavobacterium algicola]
MKKLAFILFIALFISCKSKKIVTTQIPIETSTQETEETIDEAKEEEELEADKDKVHFIKTLPRAVNVAQKRKAYDLGKRILMTCNTSTFKPFTTSEATNSVINNITIDKLSKICNRYRRYYGTFNDIELVEVFKNPETQTTIYRYKALYSKAVANKELRMTMNAANKVSSIKTMDWQNEFYKLETTK